MMKYFFMNGIVYGIMFFEDKLLRDCSL